MPNNTVDSYQQAMLSRLKAITDLKQYNKTEWTKFFMSIYAVETDKIRPTPIAEAFPGIVIPDIRKPGSTLEDLWPHVIKCPEMTMPDTEFRKYMPGSPEFDKEFAELRDLYKKVEARAEIINKEGMETCTQLLQAANSKAYS